MPTYVFKDTATNEEFEKFMSMSAREKYLEENPHIQQLLTSAAICDPVRVGMTKKDTGFKEVLQKIHERTAGSYMNRNNSW